MVYSEQRFYVYLHRRKSDGLVFYVGKGSGDRLKRTRSYESWKAVVNEHGFTYEKYKDNLSNSEALTLERELICNPDPTWKLINKNTFNEVKVMHVEMFQDFLYYDSTSPSGLRWKVWNRSRNPLCSKQAGDIAGTPKYNSKGEIESFFVKINASLYSACRIVMVLNGEKLSEELVVDHIDGNPTNNSINNLRQISSRVNSLKKRISSNNTTGIPGVQFGNYRGSLYYTVNYLDNNKKPRLKYFSFYKLGKEEALQQAIKFRKEYEDAAGITTRLR